MKHKLEEDEVVEEEKRPALLLSVLIELWCMYVFMCACW